MTANTDAPIFKLLDIIVQAPSHFHRIALQCERGAAVVKSLRFVAEWVDDPKSESIVDAATLLQLERELIVMRARANGAAILAGDDFASVLSGALYNAINAVSCAADAAEAGEDARQELNFWPNAPLRKAAHGKAGSTMKYNFYVAQNGLTFGFGDTPEEAVKEALEWCDGEIEIVLKNLPRVFGSDSKSRKGDRTGRKWMTTAGELNTSDIVLFDAEAAGAYGIEDVE